MREVAEKLASVVNAAEPRLRSMSELQAAGAVKPGRWSRKQILGHLIDSASTNHQRFVRMQEADRIDFPGYEQEYWVRTQGYQVEDWTRLVCLWACYNRHLAHVISRIDPAALKHVCTMNGKDVPLEWVVTDYLRHLEHHLSQIETYPV